MRIRPLLSAGALVFAAYSMSGQAEVIAKWVDEEGVTHFGNPQFAPGDADAVTLVEVRPANGMAVPTVVAQTNYRSRVVVIKKKENPNPRGWRGYQRNKTNSSKRGSRRGR